MPERVPCSPGGTQLQEKQCGHATPLRLPHAMLECTVWEAPRHQLWQDITDVAGAGEVKRVRALPPAEPAGRWVHSCALLPVVLVGVGVPVWLMPRFNGSWRMSMCRCRHRGVQPRQRWAVLQMWLAAEQVVGRTRVIPGRCQPWMDQELRAAIKLRRELFGALKDACADGASGNISEGEVDAADLAYTQQRKQVRKLAKAKRVALARALDAAINRA